MVGFVLSSLFILALVVIDLRGRRSLRRGKPVSFARYLAHGGRASTGAIPGFVPSIILQPVSHHTLERDRFCPIVVTSSSELLRVSEKITNGE
jgi:hypothetical protein